MSIVAKAEFPIRQSTHVGAELSCVNSQKFSCLLSCSLMIVAETR